MRRPRILLALTASALVISTALPSSAPASAGQESTFQDDNLLVYSSPDKVANTLNTLKALGVDRLRVSVFWKIVAPAPKSEDKPDFDASDPAAYPAGAWDRYDAIVKLAQERGLAVNFNLTDPAPYWATGNPGERKDIRETYNPSPREFDLFVRAVGARYSGSYIPPSDAPPPPPPERRPRQSEEQPPPVPLPRVSYWTIWNEPNQAGWLTPQWFPSPSNQSQLIEAAPRIYRSLVDAALDGLAATGHDKDTILVGETAPKGLLDNKGVTRSMDVLHFIRQLYCLDDNLQLLSGTAAQERGCPVSNQAKTFVAQHPGLFHISGWAHHPYELTFAPSQRPKHPDRWVTIANLGDLSSLLRRIFDRFGQPRPGGGKQIPLYLTEFGYQTNPPDPLGVPPGRQSGYLNQSEYIAFKNPYVRTLSQFLLVDDKPLPGYPRASVAAWGGTFQSGLVDLSGKPKPAFSSYAFPVFLPRPRVRSGSRLRIWGLLRVGPNGSPQQVQVQVRPRGSSQEFATAKTVRSGASHGYVNTRLRVHHSGALRLAWASPDGKVVYSRAVSYVVKKKKHKRR